MNYYILAFLLLFTASQSTNTDPRTGKAGTEKIVFKSTDGGQTWQDISKGLPENLQEEDNSFFANDKGLFVRVGNELYYNTPKATTPFWTREIFPQKYSSTDSVRFESAANHYWGVNLKRTNGASIWSPKFADIQNTRMRSVFETAGGAVFILTAAGLYKTADNGKTWKCVHTEGMDGNMTERDGVLVAVSMRRIIRSTDNGETWMEVINKDAVTFDVKQIKGGFAAITASTESGTRTLRTSYDGGKTWQSTDAGLQDKAAIDAIWKNWDDRPHLQTFTTSITQVGDNLICAHAHGIYRSTDKGKTWKLLLPSVEDKVFNVFVSGGVIYAIAGKGGC